MGGNVEAINPPNHYDYINLRCKQALKRTMFAET